MIPSLKAKRHLPVLTLSIIGSLGIRFVTTVAIARTLGPAVAGGYAAIGTAVEIGDRVFAGGRPHSIAYHVASGEKPSGLLAASFRFLRRQTLTASLAGLLFAGLPAIRELGWPVAVTGALAIATIPVTGSAKSCWRELRLAMGDSQRVGAMEMLRAGLALAFGMLAIAMADPLNTVASMVILFASYPVTELIARTYLRLPDLKIEPGEIASTFSSYARSSYGGAVAQPLNQRLDQLLLAALVPAAAVGLYATAVSLSLAVGVFGIAATWAMYPHLSEARLSAPVARATGVRLALLLLLVVVPLAAALIALAPPLVITVFGPEFEGAITATRILAVGAVLTSLNQVGHITLLTMGRPRRATGAQLLGLGVQIPAAVSLGLLYGIEGVAWSSLGAYALRLATTVKGMMMNKDPDEKAG